MITFPTPQVIHPVAPAGPQEGRPWAAWVVLGVFALAAGTALLVGWAGPLRFAFPAAAFAIALWLYFYAPPKFLGFAWAMWMVSPGLRRVVDYLNGAWDPQNPMTLTPFLVSAVAVPGVVRRLREFTRLELVPWVLSLACVLVGYLLGIAASGLPAATHSLVAWLVPLCLGLYCAVEWQRYEVHRQVLESTFVIGMAILSCYGMLQFVAPPEWDRLWMESSGMYSVGRAFPYELRVYSLMNAPLPFATLLLAGLLTGLASTKPARVPYLVAGLTALFLSLVRSVWIAGGVGLVVYLTTGPASAARRAVLRAALVIGMMTGAAAMLPDRVIEPTINLVQRRIFTFSQLEQDVSLSDRLAFLDDMIETIASAPVGNGLGATGVSSTLSSSGQGIRDFDNGILAVLYSLGWLGGAFFLFAVGTVVVVAFAQRPVPEDAFARAARATALASLILALGANVFEGASGAIFWTFAGMSMAANTWHARSSGTAG